MIRSVAFDFDGVLVESVAAKGQAFARLFEEHGPDVVRRVVEHHLANGGMSRFDKIRHYYHEFLHCDIDDRELEELCDRFSALVFDEVVAARAVRGVAGALAHCKRIGQLLFIVSATPQDEVREIAARRGLASHFVDIYGSPATKPELLLSILGTYHLGAHELLFIGDALADYEAAREVGVGFLARATGAPDWTRLGVASIGDLASLAGYLSAAAVPSS